MSYCGAITLIEILQISNCAAIIPPTWQHCSSLIASESSSEQRKLFAKINQNRTPNKSNFFSCELFCKSIKIWEVDLVANLHWIGEQASFTFQLFLILTPQDLSDGRVLVQSPVFTEKLDDFTKFSYPMLSWIY